MASGCGQFAAAGGEHRPFEKRRPGRAHAIAAARTCSFAPGASNRDTQASRSAALAAMKRRGIGAQSRVGDDTAVVPPGLPFNPSSSDLKLSTFQPLSASLRLQHSQEMFDLARTHVCPRVIQRHRAVQPALRSFQPAPRLIQAAKKVNRVAE